MLIYGANGYTGRLVAREAVRRGLHPTLAGRDAAAIGELAAELDLPHRAFGLDEPEALRRGIAGEGVVLHCAGPFVCTAPQMVEACLETGSSYLDITGEIAVFERLIAQAERARAGGVVLLPGAGFDVVPSDCLAARLAERLPGATHLDLAFVNAGGGLSRGTVATMIESLPAAGAMRRDGRIVPVPPAYETLELDLPIGRRLVMTIPWGDVSTAFHTTGIPNVRVFTGVSPRRLRRLRRLRPLLPLTGLRPVKSLMRSWARRRASGPDQAARERSRVHLWGRACDAAGNEAVATLSTPDGYALTARTAVEVLRRVAAGEITPGAWTPGRACGPRFIGEFEGVELGQGWA